MSESQKDKGERFSVFLVMLMFLGLSIYGVLTGGRHYIPIFGGLTAAFLFLMVMYVYLTRENER
jgi:hypothetical protein